jgi:hypothetical protein
MPRFRWAETRVNENCGEKGPVPREFGLLSPRKMGINVGTQVGIYAPRHAPRSFPLKGESSGGFMLRGTHSAHSRAKGNQAGIQTTIAELAACSLGPPLSRGRAGVSLCVVLHGRAWPCRWGIHAPRHTLRSFPRKGGSSGNPGRNCKVGGVPHWVPAFAGTSGSLLVSPSSWPGLAGQGGDSCPTPNPDHGCKVPSGSQLSPERTSS